MSAANQTGRHTLRDRTTLVLLLALALGIGACSAPADTGDGAVEEAAPQNNADEKKTTGAELGGSGDPSSSPAPVTGRGSVQVTPSNPEKAPDPNTNVTADAVLAKLATCTHASSAPYAKDEGGSATIHVCALTNAVFFKADMDIDCDGKSSTVCNSSTDGSYQNQTAATDSKGNALDAATLPYIVVPGVSSRWSYKTSGIGMGSVAAVIYNGKIEYGIVGDVGPTSILGEASYAMAKNLGINPNPSTGGVESGVTYVIFKNSAVTKKEDHAEAVTVGEQRAKQLLAEN